IPDGHNQDHCQGGDGEMITDGLKLLGKDHRMVIVDGYLFLVCEIKIAVVFLLVSSFICCSAVMHKGI
ncbi:MAG: hypothetical protein ACPL28_09275, partial [bacterium]